MRTQQRNMTRFYYRLYSGKTELKDSNDDATGEFVPTYSDPCCFAANVSPATGYASVEQFGSLENYDKVIVTADMSCPIDEDTVLYIYTKPEYDNKTQTWSAHNYVVRRVSRSLNGISIAVSKVKVS